MALKTVKKRGKKVSEAAIEAKDQRWHCRNRVTLVFGSNDVEELETYLYTDNSLSFKTVQFHQAKSKAIEEILDNCIDEFYRGHVTTVRTTLSPDGRTITVEDDGIGFPLDKIKMVYSEFRTGSKFKDEEVDSKGYLHRTLGQNGLGAAATCLTSDEFIATVKHYNTKKEQTYKFVDGALKVTKSKAKPFKGHSGVKIKLCLAKEVYKNDVIDEELLKKRIIDLAYNNPGLIFYFNQEKYIYKKGLYELAQRIDPESAQLIGADHVDFDGVNSKKKKYKARIDLSFSITADRSSEEREKFISFVNSTPTFDGGFHHDRFRRLFVNAIKEKLERAAKKEKINLNDNDILTGLNLIIGIIMPNPRFESQTKRKLVRDSHLEKAIESFMSQNMEKFLRKNKEYLELVIERAKSRHRFQELKDASKVARKQKRQRVEKLLDANERRDRSKCMLFICEGDSAIGGLRSSRNRQTQGGIAIRGKPMNVAQATIKDVLNNQEFSDIMASVGLAIGQEIEQSKLRYSKIIFLADSDVDGGHINTLLTNFFFQFWPEMFSLGMIEIAKAPLFEVHSERGTYYAESEMELEKLKETRKVKEIHRNKGLGEMSPDAWNYVMSKDKYTTINLDDLSSAKSMLNVCFGKDTQLRKDLLIDNDNSSSPSVSSSAKKSNKKVSKKTAKKVVTKKKTAKKITKKVTKKKIAKKTAKKKITKKR